MWYFISKYKNYSLQVTIEDVKQTVNFLPYGTDITIFQDHGYFTTEDETLAEAIRAHPKYAGDYELIAAGKEFTGTDEAPEITWSDYVPVVAIYTPSVERSLLFNDVQNSFNPWEQPIEKLPKDGSIIYQKNGNILQLIDQDFPSHFKEIQYKNTFDVVIRASNEILLPTSDGNATVLSITDLFPEFAAPRSIFLYGVILRNEYGVALTGITVVHPAFNATYPSEVSVGTYQQQLYLTDPPLRSLSLGGANLFEITRPVSSTPLRVTFLVMRVE